MLVILYDIHCFFMNVYKIYINATLSSFWACASVVSAFTDLSNIMITLRQKPDMVIVPLNVKMDRMSKDGDDLFYLFSLVPYKQWGQEGGTRGKGWWNVLRKQYFI